MPEKAIENGNVGWARAAELGLHIHTTRDGGIELLRDNIAHNQYALLIDDFGDASGYPMDLPEPPTGHHVFSTDLVGAGLSGSRDDLRRQTLTPATIAEPFYDFSTPFVASGARPLRDIRRADPTLAYRPPPPVMESVPVANKGWPGGNRTLYFTRVNPRGDLHTEFSEGAEFFLTEGEGLKVFIPRGPATGSPASGGAGSAQIKIGVWATEVDGDRSTARLQTIVAHDIEEVTLTEFVRGRMAPTDNETRLPPPRAVRKRDVKIRRRDGTLYAGRYRFVTWYHTAFGITIASRADEHFDLDNDREGRAYWVDAPTQVPGAMWWSLAVQFEGAWFVLRRTVASGYDATRIPFDRGFRRMPVNGAFGTETSTLSTGEDTEEGGREREKPPAGSRRFSWESLTETPRENTSGIEALDSAPDPPEGVDLGDVRPTAGTRFYSYTDVISTPVGDLTSLSSEAIEHTTVFGEIARMKFPDPNNLLENAEGRFLRRDGTPEGWTISGTNGFYDFDENNAVHVLSTGGLAFTSGTKAAQLKDISVNPQADYCLRAFFAASIVAGVAEMVYEEIAGDATTVLGTITVASLSATGATNETLRVGANTARPFTSETVYLRPRVRMIGASRNMTIWFANLALHPYVMAPRKVLRGEARRPATFDATPALPYPRGVVHAVGPAPATAVELTAPDVIAPLYDIDFTAAGATLPPTGWTHQKSAAGVVSEIRASGWYIDDQTQGHSAYARIRKSLAAEIGGSALALLGAYDVNSTPGGDNNTIDLARFNDTAGTARVRLIIHSTNNTIRIRSIDRTGKTVEVNTSIAANAGESIEWQLLADRAGTDNGRLRLQLGKNGQQRTLKGEITGIDWTGLTFEEPLVGVPAEGNNSTRWTFTVKRLIVTEEGYLGTAVDITIPEDTDAVPDRPFNVAASEYRTHEDAPPDGTEPQQINQDYLFIPPGTPRFTVPYFATWSVLPGVAYAFSVFARHEVPEDETGSLPWLLTLHNVETGETVEVGSPYEPNGSEGIEAWAEKAVTPFTVPSEPGWVELRASHYDMGPGLWVSQEWALSRGTVVRRGYGVAAGGTPNGEFSVVLDSHPEGGEPTNPRRQLVGQRTGLDLIVSEQPEGTSVTESFKGSDYEDDFVGATSFADGALVPERRFYRISGTLSANGALNQTPYIASTGPSLLTRPLLPLLLREDGSMLPGGVVVSGIQMPPRRRFYESTTVSGHRHATDVTDEVMWTNEVVLEAHTEAASEEVERFWVEQWTVEAPHLLSGDGARLLVVFADEINFEEEETPYVYRDSHRWVWSKASGVKMQVLEVESMGLLALREAGLLTDTTLTGSAF